MRATTSSKSASRRKRGAKAAAGDLAEQLGSFVRRLRRPRIAQVAGELVAIIRTAGAGLAKAAERAGVLERVARLHLVEVVDALLAAGSARCSRVTPTPMTRRCACS